jgi:antitoxin CptB
VTAAPEPRETRLKRLRMRSMRRGIKEMDVILSAFADRALSDLSEARLDAYDRMLSENDQELFAWVTGREAAPEEYAELIAQILDVIQT